MNERMYELIFESLQSKVDSGELTLEQAEEVNELAFDKYMCEASRYAKEYEKSRLSKIKELENKLSNLEDKNAKYKEIKHTTPSDSVKDKVSENIDRNEKEIKNLRSDIYELKNAEGSRSLGKNFAKALAKVRDGEAKVYKRDEDDFFSGQKIAKALKSERDTYNTTPYIYDKDSTKNRSKEIIKPKVDMGKAKQLVDDRYKIDSHSTQSKLERRHPNSFGK